MGKTILSEPKAPCAAASLFVVPRGTDRIARGRSLAASLISEEPHEQRLVLRGIHPDLIELFPPPGKETIGIDEVRRVIREGQFAPMQGRRKVCVIGHAELLTPEAANALLKVLEEPPRDLIFLLLAAHTGDVLPTILSRCQVVRLAPPVASALLARLLVVGYSEEEGKYLLGVVRREEELARFLATKEDLAAMRTQAMQTARNAPTESLVAILTAADPIVRHEGIVVLLDRLVRGEVELAVAGARSLAQAGREKVATLLEDLFYIAFEMARASFSLPIFCRHTLLAALGEKLKPDQILKFCRSVKRAQQAVEGYAPLEATLLSLFLIVRRLRDG